MSGGRGPAGWFSVKRCSFPTIVVSHYDRHSLFLAPGHSVAWHRKATQNLTHAHARALNQSQPIRPREGQNLEVSHNNYSCLKRKWKFVWVKREKLKSTKTQSSSAQNLEKTVHDSTIKKHSLTVLFILIIR